MNFSKLINYSILPLVVMLLLVYSCRPFEDCVKKYTMSGQIKDQSNNPIVDVKVRWHYADSSTPEVVLGYTDSSGNYSIQYITRSFLQESSIEFVKSGFTTQVAQKYAESEAGSSLCGDLILTRDATLAP